MCRVMQWNTVSSLDTSIRPACTAAADGVKMSTCLLIYVKPPMEAYLLHFFRFPSSVPCKATLSANVCLYYIVVYFKNSMLLVKIAVLHF